jgi:hypothetical protein
MDAAKENNAERRESFILKQTHFSVNNDNAIAWKYIDLRPCAVWQFQKSEQLLKDGQVRLKHITIDVF